MEQRARSRLRSYNLNPTWLSRGSTADFPYLTSVPGPSYSLFTMTNSFLQWRETPLLLNDKLRHLRHGFLNCTQGWAEPLRPSCKPWVRASPAQWWGSPAAATLHGAAHCTPQQTQASRRQCTAQETGSDWKLLWTPYSLSEKWQSLIFFVKAGFMHFISIPSPCWNFKSWQYHLLKARLFFSPFDEIKCKISSSFGSF